MTITANKDLDACIAAINAVPVSELKFYLLLTYRSIQKRVDCVQHKEFINELTNFSHKLINFLQPADDKIPPKLLEEIEHSYQRLCKFSKSKTVAIEISYALIDLGSVLLAIITGVLAGAIGAGIGILRSIINFANPLNHVMLGLATGLAVGATIGYRAPKKLFKDELTRQLRVCLREIEECLTDIKNEVIKPFSYYKEEVKKQLVEQCFNNNEEQYKLFLQQEHNFQIWAVRSQFVSKNLEGYLGNHACIVLKLPNQKIPTMIEGSSQDTELELRTSTQPLDTRTVTGDKIVDMLALHKQLRIRHPYDLGYILTRMKSGEKDCFRYVDTILIGTDQKPTTTRRFTDNDKWVGRNIVGFFIKSLSPFSQDILDETPCCAASKEIELFR